MLHQDCFSSTDVVSSYHPDRLSIDQILARRQARLDERTRQFPPDFVHGQIQLDEIYRVLGARWVEDALFVEEFRDEDGDLAAWSAAWFDDEFLTIEQAVRDEEGNPESRLAELKSERRSIVRLFVDQPEIPDTPEQEGELDMRCSLGRLLELERLHLGVVRDKDISDVRSIYSQREDVLQDSRTNLLSLICLCAMLAE
jgi:hypothetical protein